MHIDNMHVCGHHQALILHMQYQSLRLCTNTITSAIPTTNIMDHNPLLYCFPAYFLMKAIEFRIENKIEYSSINQCSSSVFQVFDREGTGYVSTQDLRAAMTSLGESLSQHEVDALIRDADQNSDGFVNCTGDDTVCMALLIYR